MRVGAWVVGGLVLAGLSVRVWPRPPLRERVTGSTAVLDRNGQLLRLALAPDQTFRLWTPLERMSPLLVDATLLSEDRYFRTHPGANPVSLVRALRSAAGDGRRVGGSTLTMQLARRLWGIDSRSLGGKLAQIGRALQLELQYSKHDLLEAYLNLAPYGGNVEGAGAASHVYFGKPPDRLTLDEALLLAVIPKSPARRRPRDGGAPLALLEARRALAERWITEHPADAPVREALATPPVLRTTADLPFLAPHFSDGLLSRRPLGGAVRSSLDASLQRLVEDRLGAYIARRRSVGVKNAAALVIDHRTMEVRAVVGSASYADVALSGQVDGTRAKRSPGSALKPFVYALGLEQGLFHPATVLKDAPVAFGPFSPENFDGRFLGPVTAREALWRSRNVPAMQIAARLSRPTLHGLLRMAGVARLAPEEHYGLSLVVGGGEVTMEELVTLYAALAEGGTVRQLRTALDEPVEKGTQILSPEAAFLVLDMLADNPRPDVPRLIAGDTGPRVAWKTGTSFGFRDAWTVGVFGPWVVAVWIGNFSGEGNPAFVGLEAAAPLFFSIADALAQRTPRGQLGLPPPPPGVTRAEVCAVSGGAPHPFCPRRARTWIIPGVSPIAPCDVHREIWVDASGRRGCDQGRGLRRQVHESWPSDLAAIFARAGLPRRPLPPLAPGCEDAPEVDPGQPPRITSPLRGVTYTVHAQEPTRREPERVALSAVTDGDAREVFWFSGDRLLGRSNAGATLLWSPDAGDHVLRAVDDRGRASALRLHVEAVR